MGDTRSSLRFTTPILAISVACLALPGVAAAQTGYPACSAAAKAGLKLGDRAGGGSVYATHELTVNPVGTGDTSLFRGTVSAPGARLINDVESSDPPIVLRDTPGPLTVSASVLTNDPSRPAGDQECAANVATTQQLLPALKPLVKVKRPRKGRDGRRRRIYAPGAPFSITVKPRTGSNRMPITVRARTSRKLKLPGRRAKVYARVFPQRPSDRTDAEDPRCSLVCPPQGLRGFRKGAEVSVITLSSGFGMKVRLLASDGYPARIRGGHGRERFVTPPFGADIEVLQDGRRIARLRIVARCRGNGQSDYCKFRKISTKL